MLPNWKYTAKKDLVQTLGEEWQGTYEVKQLMAPEYLAIGEEIIDELRRQGKEVIEQKDIKESEVNYRLVLKSVLHNGHPIKHPIPSKLLLILMPLVVKRNGATILDRTEDFLEFSTVNPATAKEPST